MRLSSALLVAAVGVAAHPSGAGHAHAHLHRALHQQQQQQHQKRDVVYVTATIDGKVVSWTQGGSPFKAAHKPTVQAAAVVDTTSSSTVAAAATTTSTSSPAAAATTSSSAAAADTTTASAATTTGSSSGASGSGLATYEAFATCAAAKRSVKHANRQNKKRATAAEIAYTGNTGCDGYGSNIKMVESSIVSQYTYAVKAVNSGSSTMQCKVWNKIGPDGGINGFFSGNEALTFSLAAGSSQDLVFDTNSQGGMCCEADAVSLTSAGEFLCPWLEFDFGDTANSGWSGFDASALVEGSAGGPYNALKVCTADESVCSTLNSGGGGTNAYLPGDEDEDGIGGNLEPGAVSLVATW